VVTGEFRLELELGTVPKKLEVLTGPIGAVPELVAGMIEDEPVPMGAVPELDPVTLDDDPVPIGAVPDDEIDIVLVEAVDTVLLGKITGVEVLPLGAVGPSEAVVVSTGETGVELETGAVPVPVPKPELLPVPLGVRLLYEYGNGGEGTGVPVPTGPVEVGGAVAGPIGVGGIPVPVTKLEVVELPPKGGRNPDDAEDDGAIGAVPLEVGILEPVTGEFAELDEADPVPELVEMVKVSV